MRTKTRARHFLQKLLRNDSVSIDVSGIQRDNTCLKYTSPSPRDSGLDLQCGLNLQKRRGGGGGGGRGGGGGPGG
ncbi:hypothetical protein ACVGWQ_00935, partial [Enterobacter hormaechei]